MNYTKKQILLDPISLLSETKLNLDNTDKDELAKLHKFYIKIIEQQRTLTIELKSTSRKIGAAKRAQLPIDTLTAKTRNISRDLKLLSIKSAPIESKILDFFSALEPNSEIIKLSAFSSKDAILADTPRCTSSADIKIDQLTFDLYTFNDLSDQKKQEWNQYVNQHPAATIHHLIDWQHIHKQSYNLNSYYFFARTSDNKIVGILPITHLKSRLFGNLMVSMPFFQRAGAIANTSSIETKLIQTANEHASALKVQHIEYRDTLPRKSMPTLKHKVNMVLDLPETSELLWQSFSAKLRAQIKRPQRENLAKDIGGLELLDSFYSVYTRNMRDLGSPAHSKIYIRNILSSFPNNSWLVIIQHNQKPVAAALLLGHGLSMEVPLASTIKPVNHLSINMFLYWEVLQFAITSNYKKFDFGRSSLGAGTFKFKKQWGAKPMQLYWNYWLNTSSQIPSLNPDNPKYAIVIYLWKRLPLFVSRWLGSLLVRNIP